ncbi:MAG: M28 family peptidase [Bacteroidetes bacterium]|nr:M28 family peptidase [Bacteroidota bacterium]
MRKSIFCAFAGAFCLHVSAQTTSTSQKPLMGFSEAGSTQQLAAEKQFDSYLSAINADRYVKDLSAQPHHVGSPGGKLVADYILNHFKSWGYDASIETFYVLFPTPKDRLLEMTGPTPYKALLSEPALKEDVTSGQAGQLPVYNCWSADGDVTGDLVFVNYGVPADYERLEKMGISVKGKIVIAKYGRSWRGIKPKVAQEHGAIGCLIYSDPKDDGYYQGDVYPQGSWKNEYGAQRGSVMDMPVYPGDPLTPGIGSTKDAKRLDRSEAVNLLKIPVLPISYHDAAPLLKALDGPVAPEEWRGALPFTYHVGPGKAKVHLKLSFNWDIKPVYDVIAVLKGSELPDEWVMRGNHQDAWVNGASDPLSGQAAMMEEARAIGELTKTGWKPKRTLVFAAWDGEEPGLLGSTEWVEQHAQELQEKLVLYINSDGNGRGFLGLSGSHALEPMLNELSADVMDPQTHISVLERKRDRDIINAGDNSKLKKELLGKKTVSINALGAGSDYSPFIQHLGIPSVDLGFGGENSGGEYHSIYDSYDNYRRFKDSGSVYGIVLAKVAGRTMLRMADADVLPFDFRSLSKTISGYAGELTTLLEQLRESTNLDNQLIREKRYVYAADPKKNELPPAIKEEVPFLNFAPLQNALNELDKNSSRLSDYSTKAGLSADARSKLNKKLYHAEQLLLSETGLPRRPWYRHTIYAPGFYTGYGVKTLPGIREAIEQRNWKEAQQQIDIAAAAISRFANFLATAVTAGQ